MKAAVVLLLLLAVPAAAQEIQFPLHIPAACQALAARYKIANPIPNKWALRRALAILALLDPKRDDVRNCIAVVRPLVGQ